MNKAFCCFAGHCCPPLTFPFNNLFFTTLSFLFLSCTIIKPPVCSEAFALPRHGSILTCVSLNSVCVSHSGSRRFTLGHRQKAVPIPPPVRVPPFFRPSQNRPSHWFTFHFFLWCYFWVPAWYAWTRGRAPWISRLQRRTEKGAPAFKICAIIIPHLHLRM